MPGIVLAVEDRLFGGLFLQISHIVHIMDTISFQSLRHQRMEALPIFVTHWQKMLVNRCLGRVQAIEETTSPGKTIILGGTEVTAKEIEETGINLLGPHFEKDVSSFPVLVRRMNHFGKKPVMKNRIKIYHFIPKTDTVRNIGIHIPVPRCQFPVVDMGNRVSLGVDSCQGSKNEQYQNKQEHALYLFHLELLKIENKGRACTNSPIPQTETANKNNSIMYLNNANQEEPSFHACNRACTFLFPSTAINAMLATDKASTRGVRK